MYDPEKVTQRCALWSFIAWSGRGRRSSYINICIS